MLLFQKTFAKLAYTFPEILLGKKKGRCEFLKRGYCGMKVFKHFGSDKGGQVAESTHKIGSEARKSV